MSQCVGFVPASRTSRNEKCPNDAIYGDVYCMEHRAEILTHHANTVGIPSEEANKEKGR